MGGAGWLQVKSPSKTNFSLKMVPDLLKRKSDSHILKVCSNELESFNEDLPPPVWWLAISSRESDDPSTRMDLQSLTFFSSAKYALKLVHHTSKPEKKSVDQYS